MSGCAKATVAIAPAAPLTGLQQLSQDITAATMVPGVQRAAWGIVITVGEKSKIREDAWWMVLNTLKGPSLEYAKARGEQLVKAHLGALLDAALAKVGIKTVVTA
jgi:hypothetical protein